MLANGKPVRLRKARRDDVIAIAELEKRTYSTPWSRQSFESELSRPNVIFWVVEVDNVIVGYQIGWKILDEYHLHNLAVDAAFQGTGIASFLLKELIRMVGQLALGSIELEVRKNNQAALKLYEKFGFKVVGVRKDYYQKPVDDALLMRYLVG